MKSSCFLIAVTLAIFAAGTAARSDEPVVVRTAKSGAWSAPTTWDAGRVPGKGDQVIIGPTHEVLYDVESRDVIRLVQIAGKLEFARDRNTLLEAGLVTLLASEEPTEAGFDCHVPGVPMMGHADNAKRDAETESESDHHAAMPGMPQPVLLIGTPGSPIPVEHTATIRLHYLEGMEKASCPALLNCGGRMEIHGSPLRHTWVKMHRGSDVGANNLTVDEAVEDWRIGDQILVTSTSRQRDRRGASGGFFDNAQTEVRKLTRAGSKDFSGGYPVSFDQPLLFAHDADGNFRAEVANLSRNVVVESAAPDGIRGHTMIHEHSAGSISYAEFRHLGKQGELGRYSLHFHLCGESMRGSSVIGASIWDSHNRFLTIHGTDGIVVRDCVGYKSVGHGFFLEDGTEINNVLDHNLAVTVGPGRPLPQQVIPFDLNRGAGFWFANCQNVFTRNVAVECAEYGYRFDCKKTETFDPIVSITQPDGSVKKQDTRTMPFIRFQDNEAHTMKFFCLNLRGVTRPDVGLDLYDQNVTLAKEAASAMPQAGQPFWIRDFRCWEANWAVHLGTTGVFVDGLDVYRSDVAIWRSIMDRSGYRRMTTREMRVNDIHNPLSMGLPPSEAEGSTERRSLGGVSSFKDDMPPTTLVTHVVRDGNIVHVRGTVADSSDIKHVVVNGRPAQSTRDSFAEWEITLEGAADDAFTVTAGAEDVNGLVEPRPHVVLSPAGVPETGPVHAVHAMAH